MMKPLVSVIIPCYNHELFVGKAIDSVLNSDYDNYEIIIIDDGSADNSCSVIKDKINNKQNIYFETQKNSGICKTLNKAISKSHGDFVALLASDDLLSKNSLSVRVECLLNNPNKDIVIGKAKLIDNNDNVLSLNAGEKLFFSSTRLLCSKYITEELVLRWSVVGPVTMIRKSAYDKYGLYNESLKVEDRDFFLRVLAKRKVIYIDKNVASYRVHKNNFSLSKNSKYKTRLECANINVNHANEYKGILKIYLHSYIIDRSLINNKYYFIYRVYKIFRDAMLATTVRVVYILSINKS